MILIDTHTHLFLEHFDDDRNEVIEECIENDVQKLFIPNIDSSTTEKVVKMAKDYPDICYPIIGLHPTSVNENFQKELESVEDWLAKEKFYGIGETGIDLYWDKTYIKEQEKAFRHQINLAKQTGHPLIIHSRESFDEIFAIVDDLNDDKLKGIFHSFTGTIEQAEKILSYKGFKMGIGGIVTFKNSGLADVVAKIDLKHLVLETDSPYLTPTPHRGKRNKSSYLGLIAQKIADVHQVDIETVANITTENAKKLFQID